MFIMYIGIKFYISFMIFILLILAPPPLPYTHAHILIPSHNFHHLVFNLVVFYVNFNHTESYLFYYTELLKR